MKILGIDPGIARTGWAILEKEKGEVKALAYDCFETSSKKEAAKRLSEIYEEISFLIKKYKPQALAIEELFFNKNSKTAFVVGQARGVILLLASQKNLKIHIFTPLQVKICVTGYGRAEKMQVGKMVKTILKLKEIPRLDDTSDALAVALTCVFFKKEK